MHDMTWRMKGGLNEPDGPQPPCKYFHFQTPDGDYTLARDNDSQGNPLPIPRAVSSTVPVVHEDEKIIELPLDNLLQVASERFEQNDGATAAVTRNGDICALTTRLTQGDIIKESFLDYQAKPEQNGWNISVTGTRSSCRALPHPITLSKYDIKLNLYISHEDLDDSSVAIDKLLSTF
jgi:hypothetical protein